MSLYIKKNFAYVLIACTVRTEPVQLLAGYKLLLNLNTSHMEPLVATGTLDHLCSIVY